MKQPDLSNGSVLVDTDVFSWITWQRDRKCYIQFDQLLKGLPWALSFATVGELHTGALNARWGKEK